MSSDDEASATIPGQLDAIRRRLDDGDERMGRMEASVQRNTELTQENAELAREMRDLMELGRAGFKVLGYIGVAAKWLGTLAAAAASIYTVVYAATHGGRLPHQ